MFYKDDYDHWYRIVFDKMKRGASIDTFNQNRVSFVTFNYDRSLEYFLHKGLLSFHEKINENRVKDIIDNIPIVHIYGRLDPLPWQDPEGRSYGSPITLGRLKRYKENIRIIFESITEETNSNFQKAFDLLKQAERIYILGFGFHPDNLSRLKLEELTLKTKLMATSYDLEPLTINSISPHFKGNFLPKGDINMHRSYVSGLILFQMKTYDFVKKLADLNLLD